MGTTVQREDISTAQQGGRNPLLRVDALTVRFGGVVALDGVSLHVKSEEICGVIGPNGAGKTTFFNCLSRLVDVATGAIELDGENIFALARHQVGPRGIGRTFQNIALFPTLSVRDNILVGAHSLIRGGFFAAALALPYNSRSERERVVHIEELIDFLGLRTVHDRLVGDLPFAMQKKVELARALAIRPRLLLLDEPAGGLNHEEVEQLALLITSLRDKLKLSILLVEHHLNLVMRVSDRVVVFDFGKKIAEGVPVEVQNNPMVIEAYLGRKREDVGPP